MFVMEQLLYYRDPYLRRTAATVISVSPVSGQVLDDCPIQAVVLDRTVFYPEGGGQAGDRGRLFFGGREYRIADTVKKSNNVRHADATTVESDSDGGLGIVPVHHVLCPEGTLKPGDAVEVELDWEHRYTLMQTHTAQHLLSGILYTDFGIGTVSVHLAEGFFTIEVSRPEVSRQNVMDLVDRANDCIGRNLAVSTCIVSNSEARSLGLRRPAKVDTDVRLVRIAEGTDTSACGGVHVGSLGEIGLIVFESEEKIRGNVRLAFLCGQRAYRRVDEEHAIIGSLCAVHSAKPEELVGKSETLIASLTQERNEKYRLQTMLAKRIIEAEISDNEPFAAIVLPEQGEGELPLRILAESACGFDRIALAAARIQDGRMLWAVVFKGFDVRLSLPDFQAEVLDGFGCKGGGRPPLYQGVSTLGGDCRAWCEKAVEYLRRLTDGR